MVPSRRRVQLEEPVGHVHGKALLITRSSHLVLINFLHPDGVVDRDRLGPDA